MNGLEIGNGSGIAGGLRVTDEPGPVKLTAGTLTGAAAGTPGGGADGGVWLGLHSIRLKLNTSNRQQKLAKPNSMDVIWCTLA